MCKQDTDTEFTVEIVRLINADDVLVSTLTQDINLNAVLLQFSLIGDVHLFQCRLDLTDFLTRLSLHIEMIEIHTTEILNSFFIELLTHKCALHNFVCLFCP